MIKLLDLLKESILESKAPSLPDDLKREVSEYASLLWDIFNNHIPKEDTEHVKDIFKRGNAVVIDKEAFNIKNLKGENKKIALYVASRKNDRYFKKHKYVAAAYFRKENIIAIVFDSKITKDRIEDILTHELIHAIDPKLSYDPSKIKNDKTGSTSSYYKKLSEFDAYSRNIIDEIEKNFNRKDIYPRYKIFISKQIIKLLSDIKNTDISNDDIPDKKIDILVDKYKEDLSWLFNNTSLENVIYILLIWSTKPTLYKRFMQRVANVLKTINLN